MNKKSLIASAVLAILAILIMAYKIIILDLPILPFKSQDTWKYEFSFNKTALQLLENQLPDSIFLPIPPTVEEQVLQSLNIRNKELGEVVETKTGHLFKVNKDRFEDIKNLKIEATVFKNPPLKTQPKSKLSKEERQHYLDLSWLTPEELESLKQLNESFIYDSDNKKEIFDKISYFILDEFVIRPVRHGLTDVIQMKTGDSLSIAKVFTALTRLNRIPSRISFGTSVLDTQNDKKIKHFRRFVNEFYLDGKWSYFHPRFPNIGQLPQNFILVYRDITPELEIFKSIDFYTTSIKPSKKGFFDSHEFGNIMVTDHPQYAKLSLYKLPIGTQNLFYTLLLIPFATLILSFARNVVGIMTFGVFTPILLTLFFIETSLIVGLSFTIVVFLSGMLLHKYLNKLYLLAVPKLSIILTVVIMLYMGLALLLSNTKSEVGAQVTLNYFPIVIMTILTERFMILLKEEGVQNTLKTLFGTILVAIACYGVFSIKFLSLLIFNHPELILITISLNIIIGSYTGYRLSEFLRFKELLKSK